MYPRSVATEMTLTAAPTEIPATAPVESSALDPSSLGESVGCASLFEGGVEVDDDVGVEVDDDCVVVDAELTVILK
jgi:hypothetical protein